MNKYKYERMKRQRKRRSQVLIGLFTLLGSLIMIVGSTFAWVVYSDDVINRTGATSLSAKIEWLGQNQKDWEPGQTYDQPLSVINDGGMPVLVRLSLREYFLRFEVDTTDNHGSGNGNGNLRIYDDASPELVNWEDTATWQVGNRYLLETGSSEYLQADQMFDEALYFNDDSRKVDLKDFVLKYGTVYDAANPPEDNSEKYWYFEDGYFYYSEVLESQEVTTPLLTGVGLSSDASNTVKGSFYQLKPIMDAHNNSREILANWVIDQNSEVARMYDSEFVD